MVLSGDASGSKRLSKTETVCRAVRGAGREYWLVSKDMYDSKESDKSTNGWMLTHGVCLFGF